MEVNSALLKDKYEGNNNMSDDKISENAKDQLERSQIWTEEPSESVSSRTKTPVLRSRGDGTKSLHIRYVHARSCVKRPNRKRCWRHRELCHSIGEGVQLRNCKLGWREVPCVVCDLVIFSREGALKMQNWIMKGLGNIRTVSLTYKTAPLQARCMQFRRAVGCCKVANCSSEYEWSSHAGLTVVGRRRRPSWLMPETPARCPCWHNAFVRISDEHGATSACRPTANTEITAAVRHNSW